MKKVFVSIITVFLIINAYPVFALPGVDVGSVNSKAVLDMKLHEAVSRSREKNEAIKKEQELERKNELDKINQAALADIKYVTFVNNLSISSKELFIVIQKYINQPMNPANVSAIRKDIMRYYQKKGYYSVLAMITSENTQTGELILDIKEGGRNSITIEPSF